MEDAVVVIIALVVEHAVVFGHLLRCLLPQHPAEVNSELHNVLRLLPLQSRQLLRALLSLNLLHRN